MSPMNLVEAVARALDHLNGDAWLDSSEKSKVIQALAKGCGAPAYIDSRICFGIHYYDSEQKAFYADLITRLQGNAYNGGLFHGMACSRDPSFDFVVGENHKVSGVQVGTKLYAVTD